LLESSYIHCPGVGLRTERRLWEMGARTWSEFRDGSSSLPLSPKLRSILEPLVLESIRRLHSGDYAWFAQRLPVREHWRAYPAFRDRIAFLDIETNGGMYPSDLTMVGLYDGQRVYQFVRGRNLADFPHHIRDKALIVTFHGTGFDLPFLRRAYRMEFPQLHVDLCFLLKRTGYSGGLKQIERELGILRSKDTRELSGWDAVRLWQEWKRGRRESLETLLAYNAEDVVNLKELMEIGYMLMLQRLSQETERTGRR
jgi:uncharacterized protein YprB with RNaseH-like and TPR domain